MRKIISLALIGIFSLLLTSCSNATQHTNSDSPSAKPISSNDSSSNTRFCTALSRVAKDVCLREGTAKDGRIIVTNDQFNGIYATEVNHSYQVVFLLTAGAKKSFAEATTKLSKSAGSVSLWKGNEKIVSPTVYALIADGEFAITKPDADSAKELYNKLKDQAN